ncbi:MAG: methyltransferase [Desulfobacterales bacterium]|nr:methyltransferase [Desulfobacterales bacterium]MDD4393690.1 methyltransferase [Desulfobacterales bacterium]
MTNQDWNAQQLLQTSSSYWQGFTLQAAVKLDVFSAIGDGGLSANEIADRIHVDERALAMLLDALCAMALLIKNAGRYSNTAASTTFLIRSASKYLGHMLMHHHHLAESWLKLDQAVISGEPVRDRASFSDDQWRESFLMGMFNMAKHTAPPVAEAIDLAGCRRLLDLGGGPGTYAVFFCLKNPGLSATVFDLPTTRPFSESVFDQFGLADRISFSEGNYLTEDIDGSYDVIWMSHILHGEGPEDCEKIIRKAVAALQPGGKILVHDFILDNTMDGPLFPALFALNMLLGTASGQSYSEGQIRKMLARAGVVNIERIAMRLPNDSGIITGTV